MTRIRQCRIIWSLQRGGTPDNAWQEGTPTDIRDFDWDSEKALTNRSKHKIGFETALYVFADPRRIQELDDRYDYGEERWATIGSVAGRLITVISTERGDVTWLISARRAEDDEEARYYHGNFG